MLPTILPFSSPLPSSASFPVLHYLALFFLLLPFLHYLYHALSSSLLLPPLNSYSLLPSMFFPLPLPPLSPGSSTFPSLHWLPIYLQGANRTARTGKGTCMNKQLVRIKKSCSEGCGEVIHYVQQKQIGSLELRLIHVTV